MKKYIYTISAILAITSIAACSNDRTKTLDDCPVVASMVPYGTDSLLFCEQQLIKDTLDIPLSLLAEDFELIRLDNQDEALVGEQMVIVSDNFMLVWNHDKNPVKMFDRKGNFLGNLGAIGQGPGEYKALYDAQIDEANNRIYLQQWSSSELLVYDLQGNTLPNIPLCMRVPKAKLKINTSDSLIAVMALPFPDMPAVAWVQDFKGNRKSSIDRDHHTAYDFNSEVYACYNTDAFDCLIRYMMPTREDTLYHYDYTENRLRPYLTMHFTDTDPIPVHTYLELPHHFTGHMAEMAQISKNMFGTTGPINYIIDKQTRKGAYMHLINDFLADEELPLLSFDGSFPPFPNFRNGYYILNIDPGNLRDILEKKLKDGKFSPERQQKLSELKDSIQENDNNYILLAKLK